MATTPEERKARKLKRRGNGHENRVIVTRLIGVQGGEYISVDCFFDHGSHDGKQMPFRGCCGSHFSPVTKDMYEYTTSQEGAEEHLEDHWNCIESEDTKRSYGPDLEDMRGWITRNREFDRATTAYNRVKEGDDEGHMEAIRRLDAAQAALDELKEKQMELSFKAFVQQVIRNDGDEAFFDLSYCCSGIWEQIRERCNMTEEEVPLFECTGGGRCFHGEDKDVWEAGKGKYHFRNDKWDEVYEPELLDWIKWWERGGFAQYTTGILGALNIHRDARRKENRERNRKLKLATAFHV